MFYEYNGRRPVVHPSSFVHPQAGWKPCEPLRPEGADFPDGTVRKEPADRRQPPDAGKTYRPWKGTK